MSPTGPVRTPAFAWLRVIGSASEQILAYVGGLSALIARGMAALVFSGLKRDRNIERSIHQAMVVGVRAVPIITLITFFVGVIIALQGAYGLQRLGAMQLVAGLVAISITRELGPLVAAIV